MLDEAQLGGLGCCTGAGLGITEEGQARVGLQGCAQGCGLLQWGLGCRPARRPCGPRCCCCCCCSRPPRSPPPKPLPSRMLTPRKAFRTCSKESRLAETESCRQTHTWPRALAVLMGLWWPHDQKAGEEVLRLRERCPGLQATATGSGEHGAFPVHSQGVWVSTHWQGTAVCPLQTPPPDAFIRNNKVLS
ncbi:putative RBAK downstream neighbor protein isoform X1 [Pan paniscus]|uniref:putative RBAK downstream neighbor protein isoform X1 n=1 Tax=Pan paniscus TaxID=9597 RepID=UPI0015617CEC|nr:putative RBAK downstream neighbor protein isoform X1 [Pan paniscus]